MTDDDFRDLVRRMRTKQKDYFRSRDQTILRECKDLERRVDDELNAKNTTPDMFNAPDGKIVSVEHIPDTTVRGFDGKPVVAGEQVRDSEGKPVTVWGRPVVWAGTDELPEPGKDPA